MIFCKAGVLQHLATVLKVENDRRHHIYCWIDEGTGVVVLHNGSVLGDVARRTPFSEEFVGGEIAIDAHSGRVFGAAFIYPADTGPEKQFQRWAGIHSDAAPKPFPIGPKLKNIFVHVFEGDGKISYENSAGEHVDMAISPNDNDVTIHTQGRGTLQIAKTEGGQGIAFALFISPTDVF